ncbi:DNA replication and repair protein RecF [Paraconexibacter sp. AEG42_29]|uniref:DNA replication and repair protein RecF n=1 Tax=Paraconexibacter sp. AEG42_29 TaxID=2997339 RepID=A0AAU7ANH5_9ACTN
MIVTRLSLRDFRTYDRVQVPLGPGLTVVHGRNGAGKTNLLEGLYFGCTARSCRTSNEREVLRFDQTAARVEVDGEDRDGRHTLAVGFQPGEDKRIKVDGVPVARLLDAPVRPLVSVFLPDRLELVKGPPALRRSHLDAVITALWPGRTSHRTAYRQALAQRNALLGRLRHGRGGRDQLGAWDLELGRHAITLREDRAKAIDLLQQPFAEVAAELGLAGVPELRYRPRSKAATAVEFAAELAERIDSDLDRGFTGHGPHRDDLALLRDGRELRTYGSQGEQRLGLLALLLAERDVLTAERGAPPLLLLDDVMSELDADRRGLLVERITRAGQSLITTTDLAHVPGADAAGVVRLAVTPGSVEVDALAGVPREEAA